MSVQRPNIIFIVADDLGFADLGCYGGRDAAFGPVSPVLDGLAAQGLRFMQGYANSPVCSRKLFDRRRQRGCVRHRLIIQLWFGMLAVADARRANHDEHHADPTNRRHVFVQEKNCGEENNNATNELHGCPLIDMTTCSPRRPVRFFIVRSW
jgi:hypothetical protein